MLNDHDEYLHWSLLARAGDAINQAEIEKLKSGVKEDDLATLIYTSGTTP